MAAFNLYKKNRPAVCSFLLVFVLIWGVSVTGFAENRVDFDIGRTGSNQPVDTLYVGGTYQYKIGIENDFKLGGMSLGFHFWSDDNLFLVWDSQPGGLGMQTSCVTIVPESRLGPDGSVFDMTKFLITEQNVDEVSRDTLMVGGVAMQVGLPVGPMEHMFSFHFRPTGPLTEGYVGTLCMDSAWVPPCGAMVFVSMSGNAITPIWDDELCLPVKMLCGNPNGDNDVNVGDAVYMINYIFREGKAPVPWQLGDANCDGTLDVGDVVFLIAAAFRYGPQPECPDYTPPLNSPGGPGPADDHDYLPNDILCDSLFFRFP
jgi:hypothetical protein